ncbi:MAG: hypothetical protein WC788_09540 [Candidatus Paceibacterota bacterium]|jgi:hypothetical protein
MSERKRIFDADIDGIYFEDKTGSEICHFSSVINPKGILTSLFDDFGQFRGVILLNPGETKEIFCNGKFKKCDDRKIIFGLINQFDEDGNISIEYFMGVFCELETIITVRDGEKFEQRKIYLNPGKTEEITVKIK